LSYEAEAKRILSECKKIVVVGFSRSSEKAANSVPMYLKSQGYTIIPVNPSIDDYDGMKVYPNLQAVSDSGIMFDVVEVFRPSEEAESIAIEAIEKGSKAVWLQKGIKSDLARAMARERGVLYVEDRCMFADYRAFFT
jgi:predicted CoA-binding protein